MIRDYVVQTRPCHEMIAKVSLEAKGFVVFLPTVREEIRTGRRREHRTSTIAPLFPGYLFVSIDLADRNWRVISGAKGVRGILGENVEHPTALPIGAMADLVTRYEAGEFVKGTPTYRISAGDRLRLTDGPFAGHVGICVVSRAERIQVLLSSLWGAIKVNVPVGACAQVLATT